MIKRPESSWDCKEGTPDEDHNWRFKGGDASVGEGDCLECIECGRLKEVPANWLDSDWAY